MENRNDRLMDFLNILGFVVGLENLSMNISQTDLQEETNRLDKKAAYLLKTSTEQGSLVDKSNEAATLNKKADNLRFYLKQEIRIAGISPEEENYVRDFQSILEPLMER